MRHGAVLRLVLLTVLTTAIGCAPKYYAPNTHAVPLLEGKGSFAAVGAVGESRYEVQAAYAASDRLVALMNGAFFEESDEEPTGDRGEGKLVEVGLGYRHPLPDGFQLGVYGLVGVGDLQNEFPSTVAANPGTTGTLEAKLTRIGIQPVIGFSSPYFEAAASVRLARLTYSEIRGSLIFGGDDQAALLQEQSAHTLLEPALTARAGLPSVKVQLQMGWSRNLSHSDFRQDDGFGTLGVVFTPR